MQHGRSVATFRLSGLASFSDLVKRVRDTAAGCMGLVTLRLRNSTQGWCHDSSFILSGATKEAVQLSLF